MNCGSGFSNVEKDARNCMSLFVKLLQIGGIWKTGKSNSCYSVIQKIFLIWICLYCILVYMGLYESRNDFDKLLESMSICISMAMFILKLYPFVFRKNEIEIMVHKVKENFFIHKNELTLENKDIIKSIMKQVRKVTIVFFCCNLSVNTFYTLVTPIVASLSTTSDLKPPLIIKIWTPINQSVSPNYEILTVYISATGIVAGFNFFMIDLFIMILIIYCTGQFTLLCDSLTKASTNVRKRLEQNEQKSQRSTKAEATRGEEEAEKEENMSSTFSLKLMHLETEKYLMECIKHHQSLIDFAARVEDLWKTYFFAQFLTASFLICFLGYNSMTMDMDINLLKNMGYLGSVIFQLALQCLFGSNLMTESSAVYNAIYSSDWYNQSNNYKFYSRMMIMRAQKPVQIRAGRFGVMSLPLFASMMRSSYSYLALLKQMQEG